MTLSQVVDGVTDLDSALFNPIIDAVNTSMIRLGSRGNGVAIIGDSHAGGAGDAASIRFFDLFCGYTNQRARYVSNKGVGGQTSTQIAARASDITGLDPQPSWCMICAGFNDIGNGTSTTTIMANIATLCTTFRDEGIEPILCLIPPSNGWSASTKVNGVKLNAAIQEYAYEIGAPVADLYSPVVDPTTGGYLAAMTSDNTHMSYQGARTVASSLADSLSGIFPPGGVYLCGRGYTDTDISRIYNGNFIGDDDADGLANFWAKSGSGGSVTYSRVADGANGRYWQRLAVASAPSSATFNRDITSSDWSVGDVLQISVRVRSSDVETGSGRFYIRLDLTGGSPTTEYLFNQFGYDISTEILLSKRYTVASGVTALSFRVGWISGTGTIDIAQPTLLNLTTLGLV